ncbi:HAD family hydrolase [Streptomyces sp. NPDC017546]|uniref:HAD family hydrolase n=1 Tax=Streptomyces sp. NPDC017546 TaxID=3365001 RepID=UPI0037895E94
MTSVSENRVLSWTPRAVVFDCDGVLMSTEEYCLLSKVLVLRDHGVDPDADVLASLKGLHFSAAGQALARSLGTSASAEECSAQALAKQRELYRTRPSHALPGALHLVKQTSAVMPVACATSSPHDAVEHVLAKAGILPYLVCVTSPTQGLAPKPAPDTYLAAAEACAVEPADILAVEDSTSGIRSAVAAGMRVLGVGPEPSSGQRALVDHWVASLDDPELTNWARHLHRQASEGASACV